MPPHRTNRTCSRERLRVALPGRLPTPAFRAVLETALRHGEVERRGPWLRLSTYRAALSPQDERVWQQVQQLIAAERFRPLRARPRAAPSLPEPAMRTVLRRPLRLGRLVEVAHDHFFLREIVADKASIAADLAAADPRGIVTAAQFRDALDTGGSSRSRSWSFSIAAGITRRSGDERFIRRDRLTLFGVPGCQTTGSLTSMSGRIGNLLVSLGVICVVLVLIELAGHALVRPSPLAYGRLLGRDLPPFRVVQPCDKPPAAADPSARSGIVVDGRKITGGDLYGIFREDAALGYAPKESAVSANGWWQSDTLGARHQNDVSAFPNVGRKHILVFGESFGARSRIKQEQVWSAVMARALPDTDVLNFAVHGYGMAQAYLRYRQVKTEVKHDVAIMMFVPKADPPRDIKVFRPLLSREWQLFTVLPRFLVENGQLVLVQRPNETEAQFVAANCRSVGDTLRSHLMRYDRFYVDAEYREGPPVLGQSLLYKLGVRAYANFLIRRRSRDFMRPGSEALEVTRAIFWQMDDDQRQDGGKFILVFLPLESELKRLASNTSYRSQWRAMVDSMCGRPLACIDLASYLPARPASDIDRGYDGTHYGPVANRRIGEFMARELMQRRVLEGATGKAGEFRQ